MFEGYSRNRNQGATGVIQWMMNNAWPSHIWHLYDYYLTTGGGYFGAKKATKQIHALLTYDDGSVWIVNNYQNSPVFNVEVEASIFALNGTRAWHWKSQSAMELDSYASKMLTVVPINGELDTPSDVYFVRLNWTWSGTSATNGEGASMATGDNYYWLGKQMDILNWTDSNFYRTPCLQWANFSALDTLPTPTLSLTSSSSGFHAGAGPDGEPRCMGRFTIANTGSTVAFFIEAIVHRGGSATVFPTTFSENYFTLLPSADEASTKTIGVSVSMEDIVHVESFNAPQTPTPSADVLHSCDELHLQLNSWKGTPIV